MAADGERGTKKVDERKSVTKNSWRAPLVVKGSKPLSVSFTMFPVSVIGGSVWIS